MVDVSDLSREWAKSHDIKKVEQMWQQRNQPAPPPKQMTQERPLTPVEKIRQQIQQMQTTDWNKIPQNEWKYYPGGAERLANLTEQQKLQAIGGKEEVNKTIRELQPYYSDWRPTALPSKIPTVAKYRDRKSVV